MTKFLVPFMALTVLVFADIGFAQQTFTYSGELTSEFAQFQRPEEDCQTAGSTNVFYSALPIRVEISGNYTITSQQNNFDGFLLLYDNSFNPDNNPLQGCIAGDDDNGPDRRSSEIRDVFLEADVDYVIVTTTFAADVFGPFTNTVQGPGRSGAAIGGAQFLGSTVDGRRLARPIDGCTLDPDFVTANNTRYNIQVFSVSSTADYSFFSEQADFDGVLMVYDDSFNPIDAERGCLAVNDDGPGGVGSSQIDNLRLVAGRTYYLITTGFENIETGEFSNVITGPGVFFEEPGIFTLASLTGGWFDPGLDGAGFNIVAADVGIIFTFYGYLNGEQRWLLSNVLSDDIRIGQEVSVPVRIGDGGQLNNPGAANVVQFGTLTFQLIDCINAVALIEGQGQFAGTNQSFNLRRLVQGTGLDCPQ